MIGTDISWHRKTFESVMSDLWNLWTKGIRELEYASMYCSNNGENNTEMDEVEVIDLCRVSQENTRHMSTREKKAQSKKDRTKRNPTQWKEWKTR